MKTVLGAKSMCSPVLLCGFKVSRTLWTHITHSDYNLKDANSYRELFAGIMKRQSTLFGHVLRRGTLKYVATQVKTTRGDAKQFGITA